MTATEPRTESPVYIVTGAAGGIGASTARHLRSTGARIVLCDSGCDMEGQGLDPSKVEELAHHLGDRDVCLPIASDLSRPGCPGDVVHRAVQHFGRVDGIAHLAGIRMGRSFARSYPDHLQRAMNIALVSLMEFTHTLVAVWNEHREWGSGSVVAAAGPEAFFGAGRQSLDAAAAGAVVAWVRAAAVELRRSGIRVNALIPTARTRLTESSPIFKGIGEESMSPDFVAPVISYLLSDAAEAVTGEAVGVAGQRVYLIRSRETIGTMSESDPLTEADLAARWREIRKG